MLLLKNLRFEFKCESLKFKCAQTVVGQRFAGNGPNGLSYDYYYHHYYYYYKPSYRPKGNNSV